MNESYGALSLMNESCHIRMRHVTCEWVRRILLDASTHCNTLQHTATHCNTLQHSATLCITLQHTATHCNTLQHTATRCNTLQHTATHCNTLPHTATHCNTLQHTVTHCNTLQHTVDGCCWAPALSGRLLDRQITLHSLHQAAAADTRLQDVLQLLSAPPRPNLQIRNARGTNSYVIYREQIDMYVTCVVRTQMHTYITQICTYVTQIHMYVTRVVHTRQSKTFLNSAPLRRTPPLRQLAAYVVQIRV